MSSLKDLQKFQSSLPEDGVRLPVIFFGHGSPMNGIEDNAFSENWKTMGQQILRPKAVLCISAHWFTRGTLVTSMQNPRTIHDFGGFPQELFNVDYPAPGNPGLALETTTLLANKTHSQLDHDWGLDHGTWSVVRHMYPDADIPILQLSIDFTKGPQFHYDLARELDDLRNRGVLIIGSGNMVHNLSIMDWQQTNSGFDWAVEMNDIFKNLILDGDHSPLIQYENLGKGAKLSIPTPEHYLPLLYVLGLQDKNDPVNLFNNKTILGSISMTSVKIG